MTRDEMACRLGFVGSGNIVKAIAGGLFSSKAFLPEHVAMSSPVKEETSWSSDLGCRTFLDNKSLVKTSEVVVLAVKPHIMPVILEELGHHIKENQLVMSVAAGITISAIESYLPQAKVARVMLNTAVETCHGVGAYSTGNLCKNEDDKEIEKILKPLGYFTKVEENHIDVVSSLVGSGPSFLYGVIEALSDGAVYCGLPRNLANEMAIRTMTCTGLLAEKSNRKKSLSQLREDVCSPGGSSIRGVLALENGGYRAAFMNAIIETFKQNKTLGEHGNKK